MFSTHLFHAIAMPHKQKENHDHSAKSKKERQKAKQEREAKKKAAVEARLKIEAEEAVGQKPNNIALAEGAGEYEVGCEAEEEIPLRFNIKKRNKKHLRRDVRRNAERQAREEADRLQREQEERWHREQKEAERRQRKLEGREEESDESEEEDDDEGEEYLVYICECCGKKYATTNQFANHANSRKHKANAAMYEEAGIVVTSVQLKLRLDDDEQYQEYKDNQFDDFEYGDGDSDFNDSDEEREFYNGKGEYLDDDEEHESEGEEEEESEDEEIVPPQRPKANLFSALMMGDSSSSESDDEESDNEQEEKPNPAPTKPQVTTVSDDGEYDEEEEEEMLEEVIQQNMILQGEMDAENDNASAEGLPTPLPFDDEQYNPEHFTADENRLMSVHYRLQKKYVIFICFETTFVSGPTGVFSSFVANHYYLFPCNR